MQEKTIGQKIYDLRRQHCFSQEELGDKIGVSRQSISKWELDVVLPNSDNIMALCKIFSVSADYFLFPEYEEIAAAKDECQAIIAPAEQPIETQAIIEQPIEIAPQKAKKKKYKKVIIPLAIIASIIAIVCICMSFSVFTPPNTGGFETVYTFTFIHEEYLIYFALVTVFVILTGIIIHFIIKSRKNK